MSQQLQLLVDGVDLSAYAEQDQWSIAQNWSRQGDGASFILTDEHEDTTALSFTAGPLATVSLTDVGVTPNQTLFSGVAPKPQVKRLGPTLTTWQLDCVDWTFLSDRELVSGDYSNMTADALAILITTQANCGISAVSTANGGFVAPGPPIPRIQFNSDTLTQAWTRLSKLASLYGTYGWYVDENRNLHFYDITQAPDSGWTFTDDITQVGQSNTAMYLADSMAYEWDATSIRNTVTVRGASFSAMQTDLFVGNGAQASFPLTFMPDANNIGQGTLTVGGVTKTVSAQTGDSATTDWVIVANAANQWFLAPNQAPTPAASTVISFTYPFLQPVVSQISDPTSVARFKNLPNGGQFAYYIGDSNIVTLLSAQQRGQREIATYSQPTERIQLDLPENFDGHLRAGHLITVVNSMVPDSLNGMAPGISAKFLILQCRINGHAGMYRTYQITAARVT